MPKPRLFFLFLKTALAGGTLGLAILAMMWAFQVTESDTGTSVDETPKPAPGASVRRLPQNEALPKFEPGATPSLSPEITALENTLPPGPENLESPVPPEIIPTAAASAPQRVPAVMPPAPQSPHDRYTVGLHRVLIWPNLENPKNIYVNVQFFYKMKDKSDSWRFASAALSRPHQWTALNLRGFPAAAKVS